MSTRRRRPIAGCMRNNSPLMPMRWISFLMTVSSSEVRMGACTPSKTISNSVRAGSGRLK